MIRVTIDTSEHGGAPLTEGQPCQVREALGDPKAPITERRGKLPGSTAVQTVQSIDDVCST